LIDMKTSKATVERKKYRSSVFPKGSIQQRWEEFPLAAPELVDAKYKPVPHPIPDDWLALDDPVRQLS